MPIVSTARTAHRGELSALAVVETAAMSWFSAWIAIRYETLTHIAIASGFAFLLLFRTRRSDRICQRYAVRLIDWASYHDRPASRPRGALAEALAGLMTVAKTFIALPLGLFLLRAVAIVVSLVQRPLTHLVAIRKNWRRLALATDSLTPPEVVPGIELLPGESPHYGMLTALKWSQMWNETAVRRHKDTGVLSWLWERGVMAFLTVSLYLPAILQRLSFKSVALVFSPFLFSVNSDVIRPDLSLANRLREFHRDLVSWGKFGWSLLTVGVTGGSMLIANFAASLYQLGTENLTVLGRALCAYFVPDGIVHVKLWQVASLINAVIFLYMFVIFVPRAIRRLTILNPSRFVPETRQFLRTVDVVTILLSLYTWACFVAIILGWVIRHHFPSKDIVFFPGLR